MNNKLNTLEDFENDIFRIERNGEIITLTQEEMREFRMLNIALDGKTDLECFAHSGYCDEDDDSMLNKIYKMMEDEQECYAIENSILDDMYDQCDGLAYEVIKEYLSNY